MRILYVLLMIIAAMLTVLIIGLTILSIISGGGNIIFPGLGLIISLPFLIFLLLIFDALIIFLAFMVKPTDKYR